MTSLINDALHPLNTLESVLQNVPSAQSKTRPTDAPVIEGHRQQLVSMLKDVSGQMTPDNLGKMIEDDLLKDLMKLHKAVDAIEHTSILDWMETELDDYLGFANLIFQTFARDFTYLADKLFTTFDTLSSTITNVAQANSVSVPFSGIGEKAEVLNMFKKFPDVLLNTLAHEVFKVDLTPLETLNTVYSSATKKPSIKELAYAIAVLRILSSIFKYMRTATPLNVSFGLNLSVSAGVQGRASVQADISAGLDAGVGVSAPLVGVGGDAGGGAGNTTIFEGKPLTVSITGLLVGDLQAGCDFAAALLNAQINIQKAELGQ